MNSRLHLNIQIALNDDSKIDSLVRNKSISIQQSASKFKSNENLYKKWEVKKPSLPSLVTQKPLTFTAKKHNTIQDEEVSYHEKDIQLVHSPVHSKRSSFIENLLHDEQFSNPHEHQHIHDDNQQVCEQSEFYDPYEIPANWEDAQIHAEARITGPSDICPHKPAELCPCCGYVVSRTRLSLFCDIMDLSFMGSGYPCFYNFIKYCLVMLVFLLLISGIWNIITNYNGTNCRHADLTDISMTTIVWKGNQTLTKQQAESQTHICHENFFHLLSLANSIGEGGEYKIQNLALLNLGVSISMMLILIFFRQSQRNFDIETDQAQLTPQDYTILVKNIPKGLHIDYKKELDYIFTYKAVPNETVEIVKIDLVYNTDYLLELEEKLEKAIVRKQHFFEENSFQYKDPAYIDIELDIKDIAHRLHQFEQRILLYPDYFAGIAFIQFRTEQQKRLVLDNNQQHWWERVECFFHNGKLQRQSDDDLTWDGNKLFIEESPEPNDIEWEFIHKNTTEKIKARLLAQLFSFIFMGACFILIKISNGFQTYLIENAYLKSMEGKPPEFFWIQCISLFISVQIVLFNKFILGQIYHKIVDKELRSTKSKFNISFAMKLSIALFANSAMITYFIEILGERNYFGPGGFIFTESFVFLWNALIPPLVWLIDPWYHMKNAEREKQKKLFKRNQCYLTQKQCNDLMEQVDYTQGKRYADIMKTMWFTFLFSTCIPFGIITSVFNLIIYYWIDKYNLLRKRTIKESLSMSVSIEMIDMLDLCIMFFAIGNLTFQYQLFGSIDKLSIAQLIMAIIYALLPMSEINEYLFKISNFDEVVPFEVAQLQFKTNYDRENPVTKKHAVREWHKLFKQSQMNKKPMIISKDSPRDRNQKHFKTRKEE